MLRVVTPTRPYPAAAEHCVALALAWACSPSGRLPDGAGRLAFWVRAGPVRRTSTHPEAPPTHHLDPPTGVRGTGPAPLP